MIHFPATLRQPSGSLPRRTDSLNATQQKEPENKLFLKIEEELHDARRVHSHGQEEDLRLALNMTIERLSEISSKLSEAYKAQADLEAQLHIAQSNLKLVIANNEMLEDALKRDSSGGNTRDVGWRRASARPSTSSSHVTAGSEGGSRSSVEDTPSPDTPSTSAASSPIVAAPPTPASAAPAPETSRFFRFRFNTGSSSNAPTRPGTPQPANSSPQPNHLNSPSLPVLPSQATLKEKERLEEIEKELEQEKKARKDAEKAKVDLEEELESLSQALFEEANKMVADERMKRADTEEELKEAQMEKEALRSALKILESENEVLKGSSSVELSPIITSRDQPQPSRSSLSLSSSDLEEQEVEVALGTATDLRTPMAIKRSSSQVALKSPPMSPEMSETTATAIDSTLEPPATPPPSTPSDLGRSPSPPPGATETILPPDASTSSAPLPLSLKRRSGEFKTEEEEQQEREEEEIRNQLSPASSASPESTVPSPPLSRKSTRDRPPSLTLDNYAMMGLGADGSSPWADVPSMAKSQAAKKSGESNFAGHGMRFNIV